MTVRKIIFWLHLIAGVVAGVVILVMSVTGAALSFEKEIIAWAERDVRQVTPPSPDVARLSIDELLARVKEVQPGARPSLIIVSADPTVAVAVGLGRTNSFYVNPYTGDVRVQGAATVREFMRVMIEWHRYLGASADNRTLGKAVTGGCNVAFFLLATTGLYLWWPRQWTKNVLRSVSLMNFKLRGKARDWNWHNAIGLWSAPVLIVLTATAMPISYRWAGDLIYKITGTEAPAQGGGPAGSVVSPMEVTKPAPDVKPLGFDALFAVAREQSPTWQQITLRIGGAGPRGGQGGRRAAATFETGSQTERSRTETPRESSQGRGERGGGESRSGPQAISMTIKEGNGSPRFASVQLTLDPFTGAVLKKESYADQNLGRKVRSWTRFLHTGEALGPVGQAVAGLASLGGVILVWTGFSLALRRFVNRKRRPGGEVDAMVFEGTSAGAIHRQ